MMMGEQGLADAQIRSMEARINQLEILLFRATGLGALPSGTHDALLRCDSGQTWEEIDVSAVDDFSFMYRDSGDADGWDFSEPPSSDDNKYYFPKFKDASDASKGWTWEQFTAFGDSIPDGTSTGDMLYWNHGTGAWVELDASTAAQYEVLQMGASSIPVWDELRAT